MDLRVLPAFLLLLPVGALAAAEVPSIPRPEHPMPQVERAEWMNLNGTWEFAESETDDPALYLSPQAYPEKITVPFCRESALSGIGRRDFVKNVWYRRNFQIPQAWSSPKIRLHVGACDWKTRVWLNGAFLGEHVGGNVDFDFDVSAAALRGGENTVVIHAFDDTASGLQPLGKQSNHDGESYAIFYTPTTGIWQTVWLEGVGATYIDTFRVETQPRYGRAVLQTSLKGAPEGLELRAVARVEGRVVAETAVPAQGRDNQLLLAIASPRPWSPADPFLYDLEIQVLRPGKVGQQPDEVIDRVSSYFGMREITLDGAAFLINGKAIFQRLVLDQGFYPDGIWTSPSDAELKADIERSQACGFNGARLHQKVFEPRFLYWADKLGYLVWGEYPSFNANYADPAVNLPILNEWVEVVTRDRNHPSIIGWCPFNETPAEAGLIQRVAVNVTRELDPSRPVLETSGWTHTLPFPELGDAHDYDQNPESFRQRWTTGMRWEQGIALPARYGVGASAGIPFFVSEYGGIGWALDPKAWGYGNTPKSLDEFHARFEGLAGVLLDSRYLFGLCYTQLTNVEQEQNGLYTFDRKPKFDPARLKAALSREAAYEKNPPRSGESTPEVNWTVLVGSVHDGIVARPWQMSLQDPGPDWTSPEKPAIGPEAFAPFGQIEGDAGKAIRTPWTSGDIWLRQDFEVAVATIDFGALVIFYDDETEIYLNGKEIWRHERWNTRYESFEVTEALKTAVVPGRNVLAVHTHQDKGGQYIDLALLAGKKQ